MIYDKQNEVWFGIGVPAFAFDYRIFSFSRALINGTNYLAFSGRFDFNVSGNAYHSVALYNLDQNAWVPLNLLISIPTFDGGIYGVILDDTGIMYVSGYMNVSATLYSVLSYDISTGISNTIADLPVGVQDNGENGAYGISLYTDANSNKFIYAAGLFNVLSENSVPKNVTVGLIYTNVDGNGEWKIAGKSNLLYGSYYVAASESYILS